jgi:hypothetical protein
LKRGLGIVQALHYRAFGDLDHQPSRRKRGPGENIQDSRRQFGIGDLPPREIERDSDILEPVLGIPHRLLEQAVCHLANQAGVLGDRGEHFGQNQAAGRMLPSGQHFEADRLKRVEIDDRLIEGNDLARGDGGPISPSSSTLCCSFSSMVRSNSR